MIGYRNLALVGLLALAATLTPTTAAWSEAECDGFCWDQDEIDGHFSGVDFVRVPGRPDPREYLYSYSCYIENEVRTADGCVDGVIPPPSEACEFGVWIEPRWSRLRDRGDGDPGPWVLEVGYSCPGDEEFPFGFEEFTSLPIEVPTLTVQPNTGWVYAGLETVAYTNGDAQGFVVAVRGLDFYVVATPVEYSWSFGDGSPSLTSTDPGAPWPDHTVSHTYAAAGRFRPSLTTTWRGDFRQAEDRQWYQVEGSGQTTTQGPLIQVHTARTRLVEDDLT